MNTKDLRKKSISLGFVLIATLLSPLTSMAESSHAKGKIDNIRVHDGQVHAGWAPPVFWFTLSGVTKAGSCKLWNGRVLFVMNTEAAYSLVLASQMADKEVSIRYDDAVLSDSNHCRATYITTGNPPPMS